MKKAVDRDDFQKSLLIYRSTPLQNGLSPAHMLMGRRIRSNLPVSEDLLTPKGASKVRTEGGLSLRRNRTDLRLQPTVEDTAAQEVELQQDPLELPELSNSDHADNGQTAASSHPLLRDS
uniref:Uncharacterized protein n=1 Tax=Knipowitschia caucasica TaxID=637954 RepID=A0AAV2M0U9_KNICA